MSKSSVNFEEVKSLLISSIDIHELISSKETEEKAMFIFWALDTLYRNLENLSETSKENLIKNTEVLDEAKQFILSENLKRCLKRYSPTFVLGVLEFSARTSEAQIDKYSKYKKIVFKLERWKEIGFINKEFEKHWEETMRGINEIQDYLKSRSNDYFPILVALVESGKHKNSKKILKTLRKGRSDNLVFQILASILHSNPILFEKAEILCNESNASLNDLIDHLNEALSLLKDTTVDKKVAEYCNLLLQHRGEMVQQ